MLKIFHFLLLILLLSLIHHSKTFASDIIKYEDKNGKLSYSNIETNRDGLKSIEVIEKVTSRKSQQSDEINYQLENLFNDNNAVLNRSFVMNQRIACIRSFSKGILFLLKLLSFSFP